MYIAKLVRTSALLFSVLVFSDAFAQQSPENQVKEIQLGSDAFAVAAPVPAWVKPAAVPESDAPGPVTVRLVDNQFLATEMPVRYARHAMRINDAASLDAAGHLSISFDPGYERVELHAIHIYRRQDRLDLTATSNIRFLQREQNLERGVYSGLVTASILVSDLRVGDTLDVSYSIYGQNPVFAGKYASLVLWDQSYRTALRRVIFNHPTTRQVAWRMFGDRPAPAIIPKETVESGMHRLEFEQHSMPETIVEERTFPDFFPYRLLQFSEFSSWANVAQWAATLFQADAPIGDELKGWVQKIRALDTDEARVVAALELVQSDVRYFSVSLGQSSHRPSPPEVVWQRRYGDCKDKSFLLITLLRELGIESRPVLLQIGRRTGLERTLPSAQFFDHVIVQVVLHGRAYYLDPTRLGQRGRIERLGQAHEGAQILVVSPSTSELSTISTSNIAELVNEELVERATLPKFGEEGRLTSTHTWNGAAAENLRVAIERSSREQVLRWVGDALERRYPGAKLEGQPKIADDPVNNVISITATYAVPKLAIERDGSWFAYFSPDNLQNVILPSPTANRTMPLVMGAYPFQGKYSFEITFPDDVSTVTDPKAETIENKYFSFTVSSSFRGNIAKASVDLKTLALRVEAEDYKKYSDDREAANKAIGGFFWVGKSALKSTVAAGLQDLPNRLRYFREETIKKITETIKEGKLAGADLAEAYCNRGTAYIDLGQHEEALRDADEAVRLAPSSASSFACRAEVYFQSGKFAKSIVDYTKALSLGAAPAWVFRGRGIAKYFSNQFTEAAADLVKGDAAADKEARTYIDIWLVTAHRRAGLALPDDVAKRAGAEAQGEWPRPGLAMLVGALSPDDLLKVLDKKSGDERHMALAEGYFYLAQHYLLNGDKKTAQSYFEKVRALDIIMYTEHITAGFELERLSKDSALSSATPVEDRRTAQ